MLYDVHKLFDLNRDGKLNAAERALEYRNSRAVIGEGDDSGDDDQNYEDSNFEGDQIGIKNEIFQKG